VRLFAPLAAAAVATAALATPAGAEFPESALFVGTMKLSIAAKVPGARTLRRRAKSPNTFLDLRGDLGTFTLQPPGNPIGGPLAPGKKPGRFDVIQPTGDAYASFLASTQSFFAGELTVAATVDGAEVSGSHTMTKDGATVASSVRYTLAATATEGSIPFTATIKLKLKGRRALN